jgi:hypothetical protein
MVKHFSDVNSEKKLNEVLDLIGHDLKKRRLKDYETDNLKADIIRLKKENEILKKENEILSKVNETNKTFLKSKERLIDTLENSLKLHKEILGQTGYYHNHPHELIQIKPLPEKGNNNENCLL